MATLRPVKVRAVKLRYTKGKSHKNGNRYRPVRVKVRCAGELEQPPPTSLNPLPGQHLRASHCRWQEAVRFVSRVMYLGLE